MQVGGRDYGTLGKLTSDASAGVLTGGQEAAAQRVLTACSLLFG